MNIFKRETVIATISLVLVVLSTYYAKANGVDVDADTIVMVAVTAIAALVRGEKHEPKEEPK